MKYFRKTQDHRKTHNSMNLRSKLLIVLSIAPMSSTPLELCKVSPKIIYDLILIFTANFIAYELQLARNDPTRPTLLVVLGMLAKMPSVSALFAPETKAGIYFTKMTSNINC